MLPLRFSAALLLVLAASGCGADDPPPRSTTSVPLPAPETGAPADSADPPGAAPPGDASVPPPEATQPPGPAEGPTADPRRNRVEREASRTVRAYLEAIDSRDAARLCRILAPGALELIELPRPRATCAASLAASLGYADPRGLPVWESSRAISAPRVTLGPGAAARAVVTVATLFADRDEASVEDDVVNLVRSGRRWLVARPSATLYRAVGVEAPPSALTAPG